MIFMNTIGTIQVSFEFSRNDTKVAVVSEVQDRQRIDQLERFISLNQNTHGNLGHQIYEMG